MEALKRKAPENPRERASCLSTVFFLWTYKVLKDGYSRVFEISDICKPLKEDHSDVLGDRLERKWLRNCEKAKKKGKTPSLMLTIAQAFGKEFAFLGFLIVIQDIFLSLLRPYFLGRLLAYFRLGSTVGREEAILSAVGISVTSFVFSVFIQHYMSLSFRIGLKIRASCVSLVYRKCLRLNRTALGDTSPGKIVNLISNDVSRFDLVVVTCHYMWIAPLLAVIIGTILYMELGVSGLYGIAAIFIIVPLLSAVGTLSSRYRLRIALKTDERVRLTDEVISGIQVIKMYAWEKPFTKLVMAARNAELSIIKRTTFLRGVYMTFNTTTTRFALFTTLLAWTLSGGQLSSDRVFVVAAYFNTLTQTFSGMFVRGFAEISESRVSVRRLQNFMLRSEFQSQVKGTADETMADKKEKIEEKIGDLELNERDTVDNNRGSNRAIIDTTVDGRGSNRVVIDNVSAAWKLDSSDQPTLDSLSFSVKEGQLVAVIGSVGAGKSSFLQLLLGEMPIIKGDIEVRGKVSYATQEVWVFSGSIRQNVTFGLPFDKKRYKQVTRVCALERDFELFPYGDMTLVGERGASLSGGQKARINLARAVYRDADIYLFDDPLSAVDTHVGKHLFDDCIKGFLSKKTVILVTHQLQYLSGVDHVVLLNNGSIENQGSYGNLKNSGVDFVRMISRDDKVINENANENEIESSPILKRMISRTSVRSAQSSTNEEGSVMGEMEAADQPQEKDAEVAKRPMRSVYLDYFRSGANGGVLFLMILMFIATQACASGSDYFVSYWTGIEERRTYDRKMNITNGELWSSDVLATAHGTLVSSVIVFGLIRAGIFCLTCIRCSNGLHNRMFTGIIGTSISFFNNNPSGRILNRFSKDLGMIDEWLPKCMLDVVQILVGIVGSLVLAIIINPLFIFPTIILGAICIYVRRFFIKTSKNLKRLEGIARSPVFSHLNATLQGLPTIRALEAQKVLKDEFDHHQDLHTGAMYLFIYTSSGFAFMLDFISLIFISCITFSFLLTHNREGGGTLGVEAGLAITQAMSISGLLQWAMRSSAEIANHMTATERVLEYANLEPEEKLTENKKEKDDLKDWPSEGKIQFDHLFLRYSPDEDPVLKDVCLHINPNEKVGIVGRTGAGKSSLIQALFRMSMTEGSIIIDGIDTKRLTLEFLRSRISIIPQDPVLFSGTMRRNLDPFEEYPDHALWSALEEVELNDSLKREYGLQTAVADGGANFSLGQRQLVCLARAIIRNNRILVLDEATANVDPQTDQLIQTTIRHKFRHCTVLTIAHRLNTIMDSDKVLVMDAGRTVEFGHPHQLLQNPTGYFFKLVQETGPKMASNLAEIARNAYSTNL
uniref:Multidrug resistance-associated protein 4-like protein n=1 Tax=Laodelphax striatellus TaxID=195883 RepID=A0A161UF20_LAOST|nr:multidrug resistance-associated protein 4-like protein [Laodelphax striatellus]